MAEQPKPPPEKSRMVEGLKAVGPYLDLGVTFVVAIGGGALLGYWADQHWGTTPWLLLVGAMLGIVVGFYHFFSVVLRSLGKKVWAVLMGRVRAQHGFPDLCYTVARCQCRTALSLLVMRATICLGNGPIHARP